MAVVGNTRSIENNRKLPTENEELAGSLGAAEAEAEVAGARSGDDAEIDKASTDKGKGKPKRGQNEAASRVGSGAAAVGNQNRASGGAANAGWAPGIPLKRKGVDEPYTVDELGRILNHLYAQNERKLDVEYIDSMLARRCVVAIEKANEERAATADLGEIRKESADSKGSSSSTGHNGKGKRKSLGGSRPEAEGSAGAAKDEKKEAATNSAASTPMATSKTPSRKRRLEVPDGEESEAACGDADATAVVDPGRDGDMPSDAVRRGRAGAHDSAAVVETPPQQPATKRQKNVGTSARSAADTGNKLDRGASCGGDGAADFSCGGSDDAGDFSCGGATDFDDDDDGDDDLAPSPPQRPPSSRREGASKPMIERAKAKAILGKGKASIAKLRNRVPISATGGGSGTSYTIPKRAVPSGGLSSAGGGGGGSGFGASNAVIPKKTVPKPNKSW